MENRFLFLDIDGVLNSAEFFREKTRDKVSISSELTSRVDQICSKTGAHVVISSTWRLLHPFPWLRRTLRRKGLSAKIVGVTPDLSWCPGDIHRYRHTRGEEISAWLEEKAPDAAGIVILDDDDDMAHLAPWHVKTKFHVGLTEQDAEDAVEMLRRSFCLRTPRKGVN